MKPMKDVLRVPKPANPGYPRHPFPLSVWASKNPHQLYRLTSWQQRMERLFAAQRY